MFSFPVSLMFGITGIIFDRRKLVAIVSTTVAGIPMFLYLYALVLNVMHR